MKTIALILIFGSVTVCNAQQTVRVGSKHFTEGYILSEMLAQLLESKGFKVERKFNLGGTLVCYEALRTGAIDVYPEYTGTITRQILKNQDIGLLDSIGLAISEPYGFNNTYSLVVRPDANILKISDLKDFNGRLAISYEFLQREDGWGALSKVYNLPQQPTGFEHGLSYQALMEHKIDLTDCYSTDGEISVNKLVILEDDKNFFPRYDAVSLYRKNLDDKAIEAINGLTSLINEAEMSAMNAEAIYGKRSFEEIAHNFLLKKNVLSGDRPEQGNDLIKKTLQHLALTFVALALAIIVALPLGILLYTNPRASNIILYIAGLLQTIPSIALLAIMIPLFGIGPLPAIVALFLYAILPILRNTVNGLRNVDPLLKEVAASLGMSKMQALKYVEWPLASPSIITGIRVAAVINVGTATLAAFIGAGGLGEYIVTGLALNNTRMIMMGAVPAAILALVIEFIFEVIEKRTLPGHLRKR
jgi:osmoprotectant transport system permease protein